MSLSRQNDDRIRFSYDKRSLLEFAGRRLAAAFGVVRPMIGYLKLTRRCNLDCPYCPWHTRPTNLDGELVTTGWLRVIDQLLDSGVRIFVLEGGEPTLRRDLPEILEYIHSNGGYTILATNGTGNVWKYQPRAFTVSIDGPERIHDAVRGTGSFRRIQNNLQARHPNQWVASITVISRLNHEHISEFVRELSPLVDTLMFTFLYPYSNAVDLALQPSEIAQIKQQLTNLTKHYRIFNTRHQLSQHAGEWKCYDYLTVSVDHTGTIRKGCFVAHTEAQDCTKCELACYGMLSAFHRLNFEAWFNLHRLLLRRL